MSRALAVLAEITGRANDSHTEMMLPHAVDHDSSRERILGTGDPPGQCDAMPASGKLPIAIGFQNRGLHVAGDRAGKSSLHDFPRLIVVSADQHASGSNVRPRWRSSNVRHRQDAGLPAIQTPLQNIELPGEFGEAILLFLGEDGLPGILRLSLRFHFFLSQRLKATL